MRMIKDYHVHTQYGSHYNNITPDDVGNLIANLIDRHLVDEEKDILTIEVVPIPTKYQNPPKISKGGN